MRQFEVMLADGSTATIRAERFELSDGVAKFSMSPASGGTAHPSELIRSFTRDEWLEVRTVSGCEGSLLHTSPSLDADPPVCEL